MTPLLEMRCAAINKGKWGRLNARSCILTTLSVHGLLFSSRLDSTRPSRSLPPCTPVLCQTPCYVPSSLELDALLLVDSQSPAQKATIFMSTSAPLQPTFPFPIPHISIQPSPCLSTPRPPLPSCTTSAACERATEHRRLT
ncbi:hypothetical protein PMIN03_010376 [Paraphaeosphaeria minitans]